MKSTITVVLALALSLLFFAHSPAFSLVFGPPTVTSVSPAQHAVAVPSNASVTVTFSTAMNLSTFTAANIRITGMVSGIHSGTITPNANDGFTFDPASDFVAGEIVTVDLTDGIQSSGGGPLTNGYHWTFTIATTPNDGTFFINVEYSTATAPRAVFVADVDNDGFGDAAAASSGADRVTVLINQQNATFGGWAEYGTSSNPQGVVIADVTGNGVPDIVAANRSWNTVSVLKDNGGGTFLFDAEYTTATEPVALVVGDLDGDGDGDAVTANYGWNTISVLKNNSGGTFAANFDYSTATNPAAVVITDLDNDGDADAVIANSGSANVSILLNNGDGTFTPNPDVDAHNGPASVFASDLNGNGNVDVVVADELNNSISVLMGKGDGTFDDHVEYETGAGPKSVFVHDVDGDGDGDAIVANDGDNTVSVLRNNGNGTFAEKEDYPVGTNPASVFVADLDRDGDGDIVTANRGSNSISVLENLTASQVPMDDKWNLVSVPVTVGDYHSTVLFPTAASNAFKFNTCGGGGYSAALDGEMENGVGYWMKFPTPKTVTIPGGNIASYNVNVCEGWNLIGSISDPILTTAITSTPPGIITTEFFGYSHGYFPSSTIQPGAGYWVKVDQDGMLTLSTMQQNQISTNTIRIIPTDERPPSPPSLTLQEILTDVPDHFALSQNFPNPFNPTAIIEFALPTNSHVTLRVYNLLGELVGTLVDNRLYAAGSHRVEFDAEKLSGGIYFYSFNARSEERTFTDVKKMVLMK